MFDIGWSELLVIGVVALIAIGPKELPGALRTLGQWMAKVRRMAAEFQGQFQEAMREAELDQLRKDMDQMAAKAQDYTRFDPIADVKHDIEKSVGELPPFDPVAESAPPAPLPSASPESVPGSQASVATAEPAPAAASTPAGVDVKPDAGRAPA